MGDSVVSAHTDMHSDQGARQGEHLGRSRDPIIKVHDIAWLEFEKPDLVRAEAFSRAFGYFPLARDQRAQYHRTGTVASIPFPTRNPHRSNRSSTPSARSRWNGSRDLSKKERANLMAKSPSGHQVSVQ
jgi:hypothetical protein